MADVSVDLESPSPYVETDSRLYRLKRKLTFQAVMRWVRRAARGSGDFSLLEIGTGAGFFLSFLEAEFAKARLTGIEYDPRLVALTRSKVSRATIQQGNAEEFELPGQKFDIIVSLQVIEHLYHPERMLESVRKHLKPDGVFIFTTPNLGGLGSRLMRDRWHALCADHVSLKPFDEWKSLAEGSGFASIYCGSTFFTGIPWMNRLPLGLVNWGLLVTVGAMRWRHGESFIGVFRLADRPLGLG
jgi:SAM-dependent methyltransferase